MMHQGRIWQIDAIRGAAVGGMVAYHAAFLLVYIWGWNLNIITGPWRWLAKVSAITFLVIMGCSLWLKHHSQAHKKNWVRQWLNFLPRSAKIAMGGALITIFTVEFTNDPIIFGILHHLALSSLVLAGLFPILAQRTWWWFALAIILGGTGLLFGKDTVTFPWLLWLGLIPQNFHSLDYFPLLPWMGWSAFGVGIIKSVAAHPRWTHWISSPAPEWTLVLTTVGKYSFWIYLLHIPWLVLFFWFLHTTLVFVR